jgi:formyltetrahydrofolate-dependent phosphoribosylglycinamide formyltransferase
VSESNAGDRRLVRLAVLASGQGTNLQNLVHAITSNTLIGVELCLVISNNSQSGAMQFASSAGVSTAHISATKCGSQEAADRVLEETLRRSEIDVIALAGYMKQLPPKVVRQFENRIVNVHPALLPAFGGPGMYGMRVHETVLKRGCKISGATAHLVTEEYDEGPILLQECCPVHAKDTPEDLALRVRDIEFKLLPRAIQIVVNNLA